MTKEHLMQVADATPGGARIGRFRIRCCGAGEWFVYDDLGMMFSTYLVGFDTFNLAYEALYDYLRARVYRTSHA